MDFPHSPPPLDGHETSWSDPTTGRFDNVGLFETLQNGWKYDELAADISAENQARVAIVGLPSSGKRTFFNRLRGWSMQWGKRPPRIGEELSTETLGFFTITDLPQPLPEIIETGVPLSVLLGEPALILYMIDATRGVTQADQRWVSLLRASGKPLVIGLNKVDVGEGMTLSEASRLLGMPVTPFSALTGLNVKSGLLPALLNAAPKLAVPLAREVVSLRRIAARRVIRQTALFTGVLGAQPIPGLDLPIQATTQAALVMRIGAAFGHAPAGGLSREVIAAVASLVVLQFIAQTILKFVPGFGSLVGALLSGCNTLLIGEVALRYYESEGKRPFFWRRKLKGAVS